MCNSSNLNRELSVQRNSEAWKQYGLSRATYYSRISEGLIPKPFSLGDRAVGQLQHETQAVIAAMAAGQSKTEIKALVASLLEQRKSRIARYTEDKLVSDN